MGTSKPSGPIRPLGDHWYRWTEGLPPGAELQVHAVVAPDGRYHLDELRYAGEISAAVLRTIPVGRIEAAVNAAAGGAEVDHADTTARVPEHLRTDSGAYPHEFYEVTVRAYRTLAASSPRPVADLAAANEVPVTTAQRWVKESRRRGLLPPGRPGKAG